MFDLDRLVNELMDWLCEGARKSELYVHLGGLKLLGDLLFELA